MDTLTIIIAIVVVSVASYLIARIGAKFLSKVGDRKIRKDAEKFLRGERENKIYLDDGRVLDVYKFTTFDEKGNKVRINLKGGIHIENAKEENKSEGDNKRRIQIPNPKVSREDNRCPRKKKRDIRRIRRRFG